MQMQVANYLKVSDVAVLLNVRESTIRKWLLLRKLAYTKINGAVRICETEVARLLEAGRVPAREARP